MSYNAVICELTNVRKHPNADRLNLATAGFGNQVVVGLDYLEGEIGVFFPTDGQLSPEFCEAHDLIERKDEVTGKKIGGGFFDHRRRVRSQKFRGEKSDGFFMHISCLDFTGGDISAMPVGTLFTEVNGVPICNKYITRATRIAGEKKQFRKSYKHYVNMPEHVDTLQFRDAAQHIPVGSRIFITEKLHGTSQRFGNVLVRLPLKWYQALIQKFFGAQFGEYKHEIGTRKTILSKASNSFYENEEFRANVVQSIQGLLHKGEIIYGEVVGFTTNNKPIMEPQSTTELRDKKVTKHFGDQMLYKYGCAEGTADFYVYRIGFVNEDGHEIDLPWNKVVHRCFELGLKTVPDIPSIELKDFIDDAGKLHNPFSYDGNVRDLQDIVEKLVDGESLIDSTHIREGVVLRVEQPNGEIKYIKHKSFLFGLLEGYLKEKEDFVDREEVETLEA